ncbi:MAG: transcription termination/antitermination NusG family protein [Pirellulaceae bacterium]
MPILQQETSVYPEQLLSEPPYLFDGEVSNEVDDGEERCWWAVYAKSRQEKSLARQLVGHDIPFYLPLIPKDNIIRARRVRSHIPLFAGYLFLFGNEQERVTTLTTNRISRILPVVDQQRLRGDLANIQALIDHNAPLSVERRLQPGDPVRIKSGALKGLEGCVIKRHGKARLLVAVTYLQQGVSVEIDDCALEPI